MTTFTQIYISQIKPNPSIQGQLKAVGISSGGVQRIIATMIFGVFIKNSNLHECCGPKAHFNGLSLDTRGFRQNFQAFELPGKNNWSTQRVVSKCFGRMSTIGSKSANMARCHLTRPQPPDWSAKVFHMGAELIGAKICRNGSICATNPVTGTIILDGPLGMQTQHRTIIGRTNFNFELKGRLIKHQRAAEQITKKLILRHTDSFQLANFIPLRRTQSVQLVLG